jgi:hypothetical protein
VLVLTPGEFQAGLWLRGPDGSPLLETEGAIYGYDPVGLCRALDPRPQTIQVAMEQQLIEWFAGAAAEARYRKRSVRASMVEGGSDDTLAAVAALERWFPDVVERRKAAILAQRRASALIRSRADWTAITAMAKVLLERGGLRWKRADRLCAAAYRAKQPPFGAWLDAWPPDLAMIRAGQVPASERRWWREVFESI